MLKLFFPKDNYWIDLGNGVRMKVRPLSTAIDSAARFKASASVNELAGQLAGVTDAGVEIAERPDIDDPHIRGGLGYELYAVALAQVGIVEWEGIGDADGNPAPVTHENVREAMRHASIARPFLEKYSSPVQELQSEGNASGPASHGTAGTGPDIAPDAEKKTSRARAGKKD